MFLLSCHSFIYLLDLGGDCDEDKMIVEMVELGAEMMMVDGRWLMIDGWDSENDCLDVGDDGGGDGKMIVEMIAEKMISMDGGDVECELRLG